MATVVFFVFDFPWQYDHKCGNNNVTPRNMRFFSINTYIFESMQYYQYYNFRPHTTVTSTNHSEKWTFSSETSQMITIIGGKQLKYDSTHYTQQCGIAGCCTCTLLPFNFFSPKFLSLVCVILNFPSRLKFFKKKIRIMIRMGSQLFIQTSSCGGKIQKIVGQII